MINWFGKKNDDSYSSGEQDVIAAYGAVLEAMFTNNPDDVAFDINALPYPKNVIKAELKEAIKSDPNDEGLRNCYLYLAKFQMLPVTGMNEAEIERLEDMISIEAENMLNELPEDE